jgi:hypothetical protein
LAAAVQYNRERLLHWEEEATNLQGQLKELKRTQAVEGLRKDKLGGSVKADRQWIIGGADDSIKQVLYMEEISKIQKFIAEATHSIEKCHTS